MAESLSEGNFAESDSRLRLIAIGLFFGGLFVLALGAGLFFFKNQNSSNDDIQIIASLENTDKRGNETNMIMVHVDGAVVNPGVYELNAGSRVTDAVNLAGGLSQEADQSKINLAAKIADGQKIYVPSTIQNSKFKVQNDGSVAGTTLISINSASQVELESLPGIGPVTAQKIISARPYSVLEDLFTKKIVSKSVWEKIKDLITY